jgi:hypothetical protein
MSPRRRRQAKNFIADTFFCGRWLAQSGGAPILFTDGVQLGFVASNEVSVAMGFRAVSGSAHARPEGAAEAP